MTTEDIDVNKMIVLSELKVIVKELEEGKSIVDGNYLIVRTDKDNHIKISFKRVEGSESESKEPLKPTPGIEGTTEKVGS